MVVGEQLDELPPPQAITPPAKAISSISAPSMVRPLRRLGAIPKSNTQARTAPPRVYQGSPRGISFAAVHEDLLVVVEMVSVDVTALAEVMLTGFGEMKLNVGRI